MEQNQRTSKGSNEKIHTDEKIRLGIMLVFEAIEWRSRHTPSWQHTKSLFKPQKTECCNECYDLFYVKAQQQEEGYLIQAAEKLKQEQEYDEQIKKINQKQIGKMTKLQPGHMEKKKCGNAYCRHSDVDHSKITPHPFRPLDYVRGCSKCECEKWKNGRTHYKISDVVKSRIRKGLKLLEAELCDHSQVMFIASKYSDYSKYWETFHPNYILFERVVLQSRQELRSLKTGQYRRKVIERSERRYWI